MGARATRVATHGLASKAGDRKITETGVKGIAKK